MTNPTEIITCLNCGATQEQTGEGEHIRYIGDEITEAELMRMESGACSECEEMEELESQLAELRRAAFAELHH